MPQMYIHAIGGRGLLVFLILVPALEDPGPLVIVNQEQLKLMNQCVECKGQGYKDKLVLFEV